VQVTRLTSPILAALIVLPTAAHATDLPSGLEGRFEYSDDPAERAAREQAIEATAKEVSFVIRPIARSRLRSGTRTAPWIELRANRDEISVQFQGRTPMVASSGGGPATWKNEDGNPVNVQYRMEGQTLVQVLTTPEGSRTNRFTPRPDGGIKLAIEVASPKLPRPLKYELTYNRARTPARAAP
jgi:hypothetical protein